jgi:uridylate kinase
VRRIPIREVFFGFGQGPLVKHRGKATSDPGVEPIDRGICDNGLGLLERQERRRGLRLPARDAFGSGFQHFPSALNAGAVVEVDAGGAFGVEACGEDFKRERVCLGANFRRCGGDFRQSFGEGGKIEAGAANDHGSLRAIQKWFQIAEPVTYGIGRGFGDMPVECVGVARFLGLRGAGGENAPVCKYLNCISIYDDTALRFDDRGGQRGLAAGGGASDQNGLFRRKSCDQGVDWHGAGLAAPVREGERRIEYGRGFVHFARDHQKEDRTMAEPVSQTKFRRVMLKISGEALMGDQGFGLHPPTVERIAREVKSVHDMGVEICMVIGGGNIFRGLQGSAQGMERTTADYMGMLATVMNALAMQSALETLGVFTRVISAIPMDQICEPYIRRRAVRHLEKKRVCIFAAGTGNPYFTTDTAAALRASEMACEAIFMGKQVDGIYDSDPKKNPNAKRFERISYDDVLRDNLKVADASAIALCRDNKMPLVVFSLDEPGGFRGILAGEGTYTTVHG